MIKNVILDFDGTIADSVQIKTVAFGDLYSQYGESVQNQVVSYHKSNGGVSRFDKIKFFEEKILNQNVSKKKVLELSNRFSKLVVDKVVASKYIIGAYDFIIYNYDKYNLHISTATPSSEIQTILKKKGIISFFKSVHGSPLSKSKHVKMILKQNNYDIKETIYVGDSESDRIAAKDNNIKFIGISEDSFKNNEITIKDLRSLKNILEKL